MKMNWIVGLLSVLALFASGRTVSAQYFAQPYQMPIVPVSAQGQISAASPAVIVPAAIGLNAEEPQADDGTVQQATVVALAEEPVIAQPPTPGPRGDGGGASGNCNCGTPGCTSCGCNTCCSSGFRFFAYGDFLFLRPRDNEVPYAVEIDGAVAPGGIPVQVQGVAIAAEDHSPGFRVGIGAAIDCDAGIGLHYTKFESDTSNRVDRIGLGNVLRNIARHPGDANAAVDVVTSTAFYDINFDMADIDYRASLINTGCTNVNYVLGARWASLEQVFGTTFAGNGTGTVLTDIGFSGLGIRLGVEAERQALFGVSAYLKAYGSFIAGEFDGVFRQGTAFDASVVNTHFEAARVVQIWEVELGLGWTSRSGMIRASAGWMVQFWDNIVKTDEFIQAVHNNNFTNLGSSMSFDGLVARVEIRY